MNYRLLKACLEHQKHDITSFLFLKSPYGSWCMFFKFLTTPATFNAYGHLLF